MDSLEHSFGILFSICKSNNILCFLAFSHVDVHEVLSSMTY